MTKVMSIFSTVFFLATVCTIALAAPVPGAVLYLDARDNPAHPDAWKNLGAAGGELPPMHTAPELEEGPIKIPDLRIDERKVKYYTAKKSAHMFGIKLLDPALNLEDWTIEFLLRRNGNLFQEEHQLAGVNTLPEGRQGLRLGIGGAGELRIGVYHGNEDTGLKPNLILEEGVWMWVAIAGEDKRNIRVYQNGIKVSEFPGVDWDDNIPLRAITIGSFSPGEKNRNFNGSFSLVRVYDKALEEDEILQNINFWSGLAVDPASKFTTTWGRVKAR